MAKSPHRSRIYRFLLDENFPAAPIELARLDKTIELVPLSTFDETLLEARTPDWFLYMRAVEEDFDALVGRDFNQTNQEAEMYTLSNMRLSVVTWRGHGDNDPPVEFGQLLAYMPLVKGRLNAGGPKVIVLPTPRLPAPTNPRERFGELYAARGVANEQARRETWATMAGWLGANSHDVERYAKLIRRARD